jgi:hypothetical protein
VNQQEEHPDHLQLLPKVSCPGSRMCAVIDGGREVRRTVEPESLCGYWRDKTYIHWPVKTQVIQELKSFHVKFTNTRIIIRYRNVQASTAWVYWKPLDFRNNICIFRWQVCSWMFYLVDLCISMAFVIALSLKVVLAQNLTPRSLKLYIKTDICRACQPTFHDLSFIINQGFHKRET